MFHPYSDKNKFGYYSVNNVNTYRKLEAIQLSHKTNQPVFWNFNNEVFSSANWSREPEEGLLELYRRRAQQIRDSYDYVVVMLSGGADSIAMVSSFLDNNIYPDEILSVHELAGAKDKDWYLTGEIINSAIPWVEKHLSTGIPTQYRVVDTADWQFNALNNLTVDSRDESYYDFNNVHNLGMLGRFRFRENINDYRRIIDSGQRLCLVWGEQKPRITYDTERKRHKFVFRESSLDAYVGPKYQEVDTPGYFDELFFSSPRMPEISIKQSHECLKYLRNPELYPDIIKDRSTFPQTINNQTIGLGLTRTTVQFDVWHPWHSTVETIKNNRTFCLTKNGLHAIIYPHIEQIAYDQLKGPRSVIYPRDKWLEKSNPAAAKKWFYGYFSTIAELRAQGVPHTFNLESPAGTFNKTLSGMGLLENKYYFPF